MIVWSIAFPIISGDFCTGQADKDVHYSASNSSSADSASAGSTKQYLSA